jgi:hypothetical protein
LLTSMGFQRIASKGRFSDLPGEYLNNLLRRFI